MTWYVELSGNLGLRTLWTVETPLYEPPTVMKCF
jgi:hypothetical protein